jgi:hypothetical protein
MSVLTLAGKAINWAKPPRATDKVMWSYKTSGGKPVIGSFRTIAWLEHVNDLAEKKFGQRVVVIQSAYNTGVAASAGTHDYDACLDVYIPGVAWGAAEFFFRCNGAGAFWRTPEQGFSNHIHLFVLPPREGRSISDDYKVAGFKVGKFVDGGWSLYGRQVTSSQIEDYYMGRNALAGHARDTGQRVADIAKTIFDLNLYVSRQQPKPKHAAPAKTPVKAPVASASRSTEFKVATNNVMSLPPNPNVKATIQATPGASVLLLQEMDLPAFHNVLRHLPGYTTGSIPAGNHYSTFVVFKPSVWEHVSTKFVKAYDGVNRVSLTRHIAVTVLRHKALGHDFAFLSYHRVTAGNDRVRKMLRKEGDTNVRTVLNDFKRQGIPVILGTDQNGTELLFPSRAIHVQHKIDHQYAWNGTDVSLRLGGNHTVATRSDHDALVAEYTATAK